MSDVDPLAPIARDAATGSGVATRALVDALAPAVLAVVEGVLGRANPDVEDVAQEALVGIVSALGAFRGESTVRHFAKRIAVRRAMVELRHRHATRRAAGVTVQEDMEAHEAPEGSPFEQILARRQMALLRDLLGELPEEQAEALLLKVVLGHSVAEIAEATSAPLDTVRSRLRLAKDTLRERIQADLRLGDLDEEDMP